MLDKSLPLHYNSTNLRISFKFKFFDRGNLHERKLSNPRGRFDSANLAGPVTAEALCAILREQRVSKATVYRHLERLTAAGQLRRFSPAEGAAACYQYVGDHHDCHLHPHMVCECCGRLFHLDCSQLEALSEHIREHHGFLLDYKNTILYGVCAACLAKEETP